MSQSEDRLIEPWRRRTWRREILGFTFALVATPMMAAALFDLLLFVAGGLGISAIVLLSTVRTTIKGQVWQGGPHMKGDGLAGAGLVICWVGVAAIASLIVAGISNSAM